MKNNNQLQVFVAGNTASGKSAIAQIITQALCNHGLNAHFIEEEHDARTTEQLDEIKKSLKDHKTIIGVSSLRLNIAAMG